MDVSKQWSPRALTSAIQRPGFGLMASLAAISPPCLLSQSARPRLRLPDAYSPSAWKSWSSNANWVLSRKTRTQRCINASTAPLEVHESATDSEDESIGFIGIHHVGVLCENLERSLEFYCGLLGLETCNLRPNDRLRYRGAWLWVGNQMIHLMELPNPDPLTGRPAHGGEDRHICVSVRNPMRLKTVLERAGIPYTMSKSGRPVIFTRDPDGNALECQPSYMHETPRK